MIDQYKERTRTLAEFDDYRCLFDKDRPHKYSKDIYVGDRGRFHLSEMEYDGSWDWIVPILSKISEHRLFCYEDYGVGYPHLIGCILDFNLDETFKEAALFIDWLNENSNKELKDPS